MADDLVTTIGGLGVTALVAPGPTGSRPGAVGKDPFAARAGADVRIQTAAGLQEIYSIYSVDPDTHRVRCVIVDGSGRLIRTIPPDSVGEMIAAMNSYRRL